MILNIFWILVSCFTKFHRESARGRMQYFSSFRVIVKGKKQCGVKCYIGPGEFSIKDTSGPVHRLNIRVIYMRHSLYIDTRKQTTFVITEIIYILQAHSKQV